MEGKDVPVAVEAAPGHAVSPVEPRRRTLLARFLSALGPGLITGAADDDPSGIATYSAAGALLGTTQLWIALVTWPLMAAVQMTCARVAMATGKGLAGALRKKLPRSVVMAAAFALFIANTFNIAADLAGMADAAEMLSGINSHYFVILFGIGLTAGPILFHYEPIATALKWLTLSLSAYIVTAFIVRPDWSAVVHATFVPSLPTTREGWAMLVGVLRDNNQPLPVFLAGITGSRRGELSGTQARADGCYASTRLDPEIGRRRRHVLFQCRDVFHNPDYRADAAPRRDHSY